MRKITIWLTTALTVAAMGYYYNLSLSGDGKDGDGGQPALPAACATPQAGATQTAARGTPTPAPDGAEDPCAQAESSSETGESK